MADEKRYIESRSAVIAIGMLAIIVYGSLYRFRLRPITNPLGPFRFMLANWDSFTRPSDVLANILFYVPFGFFFARSLVRSRVVTTLALATGAGFVLSVAMEWTQFYIRGRHAAMSDIYSDTIGTLLGAIAACASISLNGPRSFGLQRNRVAILLILTWLGGRLFPYVPIVSPRKYWEAVKPLIYSPPFHPLDVFAHAVAWLALGLLLEALIGVARSRAALGLLFPGVIFARILIARIVLSPAEVVGGLVGALAWICLVSHLRTRAVTVTALFVMGVVLQTLEPFQFTSVPREFGWIPFRSFLQGSMQVAVLSFFEKVFTYGCLVWLLTRVGFSWLSATACGAALVMTLRLAQVYLPGRSAEITDVIMLVIVAGIMKLISEANVPRHVESTD